MTRRQKFFFRLFTFPYEQNNSAHHDKECRNKRITIKL